MIQHMLNLRSGNDRHHQRQQDDWQDAGPGNSAHHSFASLAPPFSQPRQREGQRDQSDKRLQEWFRRHRPARVALQQQPQKDGQQEDLRYQQQWRGCQRPVGISLPQQCERVHPVRAGRQQNKYHAEMDRCRRGKHPQ
nr:hypothetical protein [Candidatus Laterigemmans baculatus]